MILVVDIGNTKVSMALYENSKLAMSSFFTCPKNISSYALILVLEQIFPKDTIIDNGIISSVVDELTQPICEAVSNVYHINPIVINVTCMDVGIPLKCNNPERIGTDRIANALAASRLYDKRPVIVVDSGSATTFDIIDKDNNFIGGLIMPGLDMQLKSLAEDTSKLPEIKLDMMEQVQTYINTDTKKAILSGVVFGQAQAIQGLITRCEKELKTKAFVVGAGGNAKLLNKYMKYRKFDVINPNLTFDGINMIYELNME